MRFHEGKYKNQGAYFRPGIALGKKKPPEAARISMKRVSATHFWRSAAETLQIDTLLGARSHDYSGFCSE